MTKNLVKKNERVKLISPQSNTRTRFQVNTSTNYPVSVTCTQYYFFSYPTLKTFFVHEPFPPRKIFSGERRISSRRFLRKSGAKVSMVASTTASSRPRGLNRRETVKEKQHQAVARDIILTIQQMRTVFSSKSVGLLFHRTHTVIQNVLQFDKSGIRKYLHRNQTTIRHFLCISRQYIACIPPISNRFKTVFHIHSSSPGCHYIVRKKK